MGHDRCVSENETPQRESEPVVTAGEAGVVPGTGEARSAVVRRRWRLLVVVVVAGVLSASVTFLAVRHRTFPDPPAPPGNVDELRDAMTDAIDRDLGGPPEMLIPVTTESTESAMTVIPAGDYRLGLMCGVLATQRESAPEITVRMQSDVYRDFLIPCPSTPLWIEERLVFTEDLVVSITAMQDVAVGGWLVLAVLDSREAG
ncbi:hypothetical protein LX16_1777 [Stackebrandtia albiflava]|uniref:Uncharacterized protein n=1 Tax=Stackebrandtia albiflava TaxID=406432 RepID=A0A562VDW7_9ACTN|nr:hypothetical protein LX16_1777 [Stackebrandtia albiflava]